MYTDEIAFRIGNIVIAGTVNEWALSLFILCVAVFFFSIASATKEKQ